MWLRLLIPVLALAVCGRAHAQQQLLYTTFGPGHSYANSYGLLIGDGVAWLLSGNNGAMEAIAFTPQTTTPFSRADFAVMYGITEYLSTGATVVESGPPSLDITLASDSGGFPGSALETFHLTNVLGGSQAPGVFSVNSVERPVLAEGRQYWFVLSTPDLLNTAFSWNDGPPGVGSTATTSQVLSQVTTISGWGPVTFPQGNRPSIAVYGGYQTPIPIPSVAPYGTVNAASYLGGGSVSPGEWVSIFGTNLSQTSRGWQPSDFGQDGALPVSLDGVSVLVNGSAAALSYVSPNQLNVLIPDQSLYQFPFAIQVVTSAGASVLTPISLQLVNPALFTVSQGAVEHALATFADGRPVSPEWPARPGDAIALYGTGFGPSVPSIPVGVLVQTPEPLEYSAAVSVTVGGVPAQVLYAGIVEAGLDQINIVVPQVPPGDQTLLVSILNSPSQGAVFLPIRNP